MGVKRLETFFEDLFFYESNQYTEKVCIPIIILEEWKNRPLEDVTRPFLATLFAFRETFSGSFQSMFSKMSHSIFSSELYFFAYVNAICAKLSQTDAFFSFIMICTFLTEMTRFLLKSRCCRFDRVLPEVSVHVIEKNFDAAFYTDRGFSELHEKCRCFNRFNTLDLISSDFVSRFISNELGAEHFRQEFHDLRGDASSFSVNGTTSSANASTVGEECELCNSFCFRNF